MSEKKNKADLRLLAFGAFAGLVVAGIGLLQQEASTDVLPEGAVARVNDVVISRDVYARAISRSTDYAGRPVESDGAAMLQRLIDAELLIQRGIDLGMTQSDTVVRQAVIDSLISSVTSEARAASPTEDELAKYLADNAERFSYVSKVSAQAWQTDDEPAAQKFVAALRGDNSDPEIDGVQAMPDFPGGEIALDTLATYVGPGIAAAVAEIPTGSSAIFARRGRWLVIRINAKEWSTLSELNKIRNRVLIDYRRNLADQTLKNYIEELRQRASISVAEQ